MQKKFLIPISFKTEAVAVIYSSSFDGAIEEANRLKDVGILFDKIDPSSTKVDDTSIDIQEMKAQDINPRKIYTVTVKKTLKTDLDIVAHSVIDAENIAHQMLNNDELHDSDFEQIENSVVGLKI